MQGVEVRFGAVGRIPRQVGRWRSFSPRKAIKGLRPERKGRKLKKGVKVDISQ